MSALPHHAVITSIRNMGAGSLKVRAMLARRILNLCARLWRDKGSTLTWLAEAPLIQLLENRRARKPSKIHEVCRRSLCIRGGVLSLANHLWRKCPLATLIELRGWVTIPSLAKDGTPWRLPGRCSRGSIR
jgi:hypothetical protein